MIKGWVVPAAGVYTIRAMDVWLQGQLSVSSFIDDFIADDDDRSVC